MRNYILVALIVAICSSWTVNASEDIHKASLDQISNQVIQSAKSLNFPTPKFKELGVVAFSQREPTRVSYGHYRVDETNFGLTSLSTASTRTFETQDVAYNLFVRGFLDEGRTLKHELRSNGSGVSTGGLIELMGVTRMNMRTSNALKILPTGFSHSMAIETKITKLEKISGQLFPLKVGNKLSIQYASENSMEKGKKRTKVYEYEVTKKIASYVLNGSELPGDVFEITLHSDESKKGKVLPATFLFSSHLGWIIESHIGNITEKVVGWI